MSAEPNLCTKLSNDVMNNADRGVTFSRFTEPQIAIKGNIGRGFRDDTAIRIDSMRMGTSFLPSKSTVTRFRSLTVKCEEFWSQLPKEPELAFEEATADTFAGSCQLVIPGRATQTMGHLRQPLLHATPETKSRRPG